jgi:hypothetical protein
MRTFFVLHARMQAFLRAWNLADEGNSYAHSTASLLDVDFLRILQASLGDPVMDDEALRSQLRSNLALLEKFARTWQSIASEQYPSLARFVSAPESSEHQLDVGALRMSLPRLPA